MDGLTILSYKVTDDLQDARGLIERIREQMPPRLAAKLTTARDLVEEVEDALADGPAGDPGQ